MPLSLLTTIPNTMVHAPHHIISAWLWQVLQSLLMFPWPSFKLHQNNHYRQLPGRYWLDTAESDWCVCLLTDRYWRDTAESDWCVCLLPPAVTASLVIQCDISRETSFIYNIMKFYLTVKIWMSFCICIKYIYCVAAVICCCKPPVYEAGHGVMWQLSYIVSWEHLYIPSPMSVLYAFINQLILYIIHLYCVLFDSAESSIVFSHHVVAWYTVINELFSLHWPLSSKQYSAIDLFPLI